MEIVIQPEIVSSLIITTFFCLLFVYLGGQIKKADPLKKPTGAVLMVETVVNILQNYFRTIFPNQRLDKKLTPYFSCLALYIFVSNVSGLICLESPTSNFSITLTLSLITFSLIQMTAARKKGLGLYVKELVWPPPNILSAVSPLIALSMRLCGNIVSGGVLMSLLYATTNLLSEWIFGFIPFNVVAPVIAPVLHGYFDIFAGFIQTFIFVTLSSIFISLEE